MLFRNRASLTVEDVSGALCLMVMYACKYWQYSSVRVNAVGLYSSSAKVCVGARAGVGAWAGLNARAGLCGLVRGRCALNLFTRAGEAQGGVILVRGVGDCIELRPCPCPCQCPKEIREITEELRCDILFGFLACHCPVTANQF